MSNEKNADDPLGRTLDNVRFSFQDFFVEFLGGLVPGVLFLLGGFLSLAHPLDSLVSEQVRLPGTLAKEMLATTLKTPSIIWLILSMMAILVAYVLGQLFYRQEPKKPDQRSLRRITKGIVLTPDSSTVGLMDVLREIRALYLRMWGYKVERLTKAQYNDRLREDYGCTIEDCDFPYLHLKAYLRKRGHKHLLPLVRWDPMLPKEKGREQHADYRSKTYINLLKIRLHYHHPKKCGAIVRNEGHVRLASSTWYVARALSWLSVAGLILGAIAASHTKGDTVWAGRSVFLGPVLVLITSWYCGVTIEKVLHYQRLREVCFVLETAFTAFRNTPHLLDPPFRKFCLKLAQANSEASGERLVAIPADCPKLPASVRKCPFLPQDGNGTSSGS